MFSFGLIALNQIWLKAALVEHIVNQKLTIHSLREHHIVQCDTLECSILIFKLKKKNQILLEYERNKNKHCTPHIHHLTLF